MRPHMLAAALLAGQAWMSAETPGKVLVGVYHWGGAASKSMTGGVAHIAALGGHAVRVTLSPTYYADYGLGRECYRDYSLAALARQADVAAALSYPGIELVMLTAYDGTGFGDCRTQRYVNPEFYTPENAAAMVREYSDLTLHLYQAYHDSGKAFIISNWEADNTVYCGAAYAYATDPKFRAECDAAYPALYNGNAGPWQTLEGLRRWLETRERGIADGRRRALAVGLAGIEVYQAPEISIVHALADAGLGSVLYDVLPGMGFEHVSYSSYESINQADPGGALARDIETIRAITGSPHVIIGEMGFARSQWGSEVIGRLQAVISAAAASGVRLIIHWQLFDQDPQNDFGLYDSQDQVTEAALYFQRVFAGAISTDTSRPIRRLPGSGARP